MQCKHCGKELASNAKVCSYCGNSLAEEFVTMKEPDLWFYSIEGETFGPYSNNDIVALFKKNTINENTYVWKKGMEDWILWKDSDLADPSLKETPEANWYYVDSETNEQFGPMPKYEIVSLIRNETIDASTYVWKIGMEDWVRLSQSELKDECNTFSHRSYSRGNDWKPIHYGIKKRDVPIQVLLSFVTCGIYLLVWMYLIAEDTNCILRNRNRKELTSGAVVILLSVVTCGIYSLYFYWNVCKHLSMIETDTRYVVQDNSLIAFIFAFVGLPVVSLAIIQDEINGIIDHV